MRGRAKVGLRVYKSSLRISPADTGYRFSYRDGLGGGVAIELSQPLVGLGQALRVDVGVGAFVAPSADAMRAFHSPIVLRRFVGNLSYPHQLLL